MTLRNPESTGKEEHTPIEELGHWRLGAMVAHLAVKARITKAYKGYDYKELKSAYENSSPRKPEASTDEEKAFRAKLHNDRMLGPDVSEATARQLDWPPQLTPSKDPTYPNYIED